MRPGHGLDLAALPGINSCSVVPAWRKGKTMPPRSQVDFWNVVEFPGRRALPQEMMEIAALAAIDRIRPDMNVW